MRTDGVHRKESAETGPVTLESGSSNRCLKKNQSTPRPSEHPPVMGEKMSKRLLIQVNPMGSAYLQSMDFQREPQSKHHLYFLDCFLFTSSPTRPNPTHIANANPDPHLS